jgi:hypothetical protein
MSKYTLVPGYMMPFGDKQLLVFDQFGPASYQNVSTNGLTGQTVHVGDFNVGGVDAILLASAISASGNYLVRIYQPTALNGASPISFVMRWFNYPAAATTGATGTEVAQGTNLSAESIRIAMICI